MISQWRDTRPRRFTDNAVRIQLQHHTDSASPDNERHRHCLWMSLRRAVQNLRTDVSKEPQVEEGHVFHNVTPGSWLWSHKTKSEFSSNLVTSWLSHNCRAEHGLSVCWEVGNEHVLPVVCSMTIQLWNGHDIWTQKLRNKLLVYVFTRLCIMPYV